MKYEKIYVPFASYPSEYEISDWELKSFDLSTDMNEIRKDINNGMSKWDATAKHLAKLKNELDCIISQNLVDGKAYIVKNTDEPMIFFSNEAYICLEMWVLR